MSENARFDTPTAASDELIYRYNATLDRWELTALGAAVIPDGSITAAKLASGAVTGSKVADGAVTPAKLAGSGARDNTTFYRGDGAWVVPPSADFNRILSSLTSPALTARATTDSNARFELLPTGHMRWGAGNVAPGQSQLQHIAGSNILHVEGQFRVSHRIIMGAASDDPNIIWGSGQPNGVVPAYPGSIYFQKDGTTGQTAWFKESGAGTNTGWISRGTSGGGSSGAQAVAYAASITPDPSLGEVVVVGTLTGNLTVNSPVVSTPGRFLEFHYQQDGTGGRTVTYGGVFETPAPIDPTAGARSYQRFRCITSTLWVEVA